MIVVSAACSFDFEIFSFGCSIFLSRVSVVVFVSSSCLSFADVCCSLLSSELLTIYVIVHV